MSAEAARLAAPTGTRGGSARRTLVLLAIATLPFTYAFTVDLRFPLKIYEVALALALLTSLLDLRLPIAPGSASVVRRLAWFGVAAAMLTVLRFAIPVKGFSEGTFGTRFGPAGDAGAKLMYLALAICGFLLCARTAYSSERAFLRAWSIGAVAAAAYSWYLFLAGLLGLDPLLLPGIENPKYFAVAGRTIIRSGTFQEGNFLGLYLLISVGVALFARRRLLAAALSATVFLTFSTVNVLGLGLLWLMVWWREHPGLGLRRRLLYIGAATLLCAGLGVLLLKTGYLQSVIVYKLTSDAPGSRIKRVAYILAGLRMFADHPVLGVGISQFGYYYNAYQSLGALGEAQSIKVIPNNIYVELLSELGVPGLVLFGLFLWSVYRRLEHPSLGPLRLTFIVTLFAFNAFPTYTVMFLWAFLGLALGAAVRYSRAAPSQPHL